jgi:hypothetical protein
MAYVATFQFEIVPGKMDEAMAALNKLKALHEASGSKSRILLPYYSGETFGRVIYVSEHDDVDSLASQFKGAEAAMASGEAPVSGAVWGADPCLKAVGSSLLMEV